MNTNSVRILMSSLIKARKRKFQEILPEMTRDIRNVHRGQCQACGDCEAFISVSGRVLCDYCGCPPAQHENLAREISKKSKDSNSADLVTADVSSLEIQELDDIVDSDEDHSSSEEADNEEVDSLASSLDSSKASSISSSTGSNSSQKSGY